MEWRIKYSSDSEKFISLNEISRNDVRNLIVRALLKFKGERVNIDIKKLRGKWEGFYRIRKYRIRKGNLRIIVSIDFKNRNILVYSIDFRGSIYGN